MRALLAWQGQASASFDGLHEQYAFDRNNGGYSMALQRSLQEVQDHKNWVTLQAPRSLVQLED